MDTDGHVVQWDWTTYAKHRHWHPIGLAVNISLGRICVIVWREWKVFTLTSHNFCISWNSEFVDLKWQLARLTMATWIRQPLIQSNNHNCLRIWKCPAQQGGHLPYDKAWSLRTNTQMDACYNEIGLHAQNIDNNPSSLIVHTIGRAYVVVPSDIKSFLPFDSLITFAFHPYRNLKWPSVYIINHNCWPDERIPDPTRSNNGQSYMRSSKFQVPHTFHAKKVGYTDQTGRTDR